MLLFVCHLRSMIVRVQFTRRCKVFKANLIQITHKFNRLRCVPDLIVLVHCPNVVNIDMRIQCHFLLCASASISLSMRVEIAAHSAIVSNDNLWTICNVCLCVNNKVCLFVSGQIYIYMWVGARNTYLVDWVPVSFPWGSTWDVSSPANHGRQHWESNWNEPEKWLNRHTRATAW